MKPQKFFNFVLPFDIYQQLKQLSMDRDESIAALIRESIDLLFDKKDTVEGGNKNR